MKRRRFLIIGMGFCILLAAVGVFFELQRPYKIAGAQALARNASMSNLGDLLGDKDAHVRLAAAQEIDMRAKMESPVELAPALSRAIKDENDEVVRLAAFNLVGICSARPEILLVLINGMKSDRARTRSCCAAAIGNCDLQAKEAIPALLEALDDEDTRVRQSASNALRLKVRPDSKDAVPNLVKALKDKDHEVRQFIAYALGNIGPVADEAVPALIDCCHDTNESVRFAASMAFGQIGPKAKAGVPTLIQVMSNKYESRLVRPVATKALGQIGSDALEAIPALKVSLGDTDYCVRAGAAYALWRIDQDSDLVVPAVIQILNGSDYLAERRVVQYVGELGSNAKPAIPALIQVMDKEVDWFRPHVFAAIQKIDTEAAAKVKP